MLHLYIKQNKGYAVKGAGFNCNPAASGVRAAWVFGNLNDNGNDGVSCRHSNNWPGNANWNGSLGATGTDIVRYDYCAA